MTEAEVLAEARRDDRRMQLCEADKDACENITPRSASPSSVVRSLASPVSDEIEDAIFNGRDVDIPPPANVRLARIFNSAHSYVPEEPDVERNQLENPIQSRKNIGTDPIIFTDSQGSEKSVEVIDGPLQETKQEMIENFFLLNNGKKVATKTLDGFWRVYAKKSSTNKVYYCSACESCRTSSRRSSDFSEFSLPSLSFNDKNEPVFDGVEHRAGCVGYPLDEVKSQRSLPPIQWVMRFGNVGESHGTAYLIIARSTARKAKFSIIYCGISGDNVNNAQDGNQGWSVRMSVHLKSKLFANYKEIGFVKLLEGAPVDKIRKWECKMYFQGMVYSKNLIDKRVTQYFEDYPSNDDYSINLLNSEYPFKDLNIASFSVEQANEYLDEAIARAVNALKDTVPIWREIKQ
uniref:YDG domain-containing protein n=1 Tax=Ditylenchus dipsaci TaxID=166011 RepID=A0A915DIW9_9BILA